MKVALFSSQNYEKPFFNQFASQHNNIEITYFHEQLNEQTSQMASGFDAICAFVNDKLDNNVLVQLSNIGVKFVALRCAGFNNVDLKVANELNIKVARVPAYSPEAVAEHCIALILTLSRKTHKAYNRVREDNFDLNGLLGFNLHRKTVGVIGCGKIGQAFINILNGFGADVLVYDPYVQGSDYNLVDLDTLLSQSDIISLHCPLTEATHHLVDDEAFAKMKDGVMLINTSRGALLDSKACIKALKSKKLGYLGLDVYEQESELFFQNRSGEINHDDVFSRLVSFPNVLITGHQGFFTKEALEEIARVTLTNLNEFATGQKVKNQVL